MSKKLTTQEFIEKAKLVHNDKYDYSLVNYLSTSLKIKIIDGDGFKHLIRPNSLLSGNKLNLRSVIDKEQFLINKFNKIHNYKFNYSHFKYNNSREKINIVCLKHGVFKQTIDNHLKGKCCPKCNGKNKDSNEIILDFIKVHGNKYDYSKVNYTKIKDKVSIICPLHGEFNQITEEHLKGCGCPICKESNGEREIRLWLNKNNLIFTQQHKFTDCKNINPLPFDFYLPDYNTCVEFQGEQHYKAFKYFGGEDKLIKTQINDSIKSKYCIENNINLIIINFNENIVNKLTTTLTR